VAHRNFVPLFVVDSARLTHFDALLKSVWILAGRALPAFDPVPGLGETECHHNWQLNIG